MQYSNHTDNLNRAIAFEVNQKDVTRFGGLAPLMNRARRSGVPAALARVIDKYTPRNHFNFVYDTEDLINQVLASLAAGMPDFNDVEYLSLDKSFVSALRIPKVASAPTLSRFFSRFEARCKHDQMAALARDKAVLPRLKKTDPRRITTPAIMDLIDFTENEAIRILRKRGDKERFIIDVDSTPVELFGSQHEACYDGHYRCISYLPIFVAINGVPAFVQNAPGAANGAALCLIHIRRLIQKLKESFPGAWILVRGDTGYNNTDLLRIIEDEEVSYILGYNVRPKDLKTKLFKHIAREYASDPNSKICMAKEILAEIPLSGLFGEAKPPKRRRKLTSTTAGNKFRCCGFFHNYRAQTWKSPRTVVYRLQFSDQFKEVDARFIQTNLSIEEARAFAKGRGLKKYRALPGESFEQDKVNAEISIEIYEEIFCSRGEDERLNCEWKSSCCASRCSLNGFFANSLRMTITLVIMQIMEELRHALLRREQPYKPLKKRRSQKRNTTRAHCAEKRRFGPTIRLIRQFLICVPAKVRELQSRIVFSLSPMPEAWQRRFEILME